MNINLITYRISSATLVAETLTQNKTTPPVKSGHTFSHLEKQSPLAWESHGMPASTTPIGYSFDANKPTQKSDELYQIMANVNLRHISPNELKDTVSKALSVRGEISDQAANEFILLGMAKDNMDRDAPMDVLQFYEDIYSSIDSEIAAGATNLSEARKMYGDTLHTLYNLDNFIQFIKNGSQHINANV